MDQKKVYETYVQSLLTDDIYEAYEEAAKKFKTWDLIVASNDKEITNYKREDMLAHLKKIPDAPPLLIESFEIPASESLVPRRTVWTPTFWFVADSPDGTTLCCAISTWKSDDRAN